MTRAAEQALLAKLRAGKTVTVADHIPTIDDADELEAFRAGLIGNGRMTPDLQTAIYRQQIKIGRASTHG